MQSLVIAGVEICGIKKKNLELKVCLMVLNVDTKTKLPH